MKPKQLRDWFCAVGFRPIGRRWHEQNLYISRSPKWASHTSRGIRRARVLEDRGIIQVCDGNFDRWANSVGHGFDIPTCRADFITRMEECRGYEPAKVRRPMILRGLGGNWDGLFPFEESGFFKSLDESGYAWVAREFIARNGYKTPNAKTRWPMMQWELRAFRGLPMEKRRFDRWNRLQSKYRMGDQK